MGQKGDGWSCSTKNAEVQQKIFQGGKVLHMNVDNLVERRVHGRVNSAKFNTMIRIALFLCNVRKAGRERGNNFRAK